LSAEFDAEELARELDASGIGVWGKERPDTLVWLIIDTGVGRRIVTSDEPEALATAAAQRAQARAVPVLLPLMEIEDTQRLSAAIAWPALADAAHELGRRYATPATLVGHVIQSASSAWSVRWRLFLDGETLDWTQQGELPEQLVADGIDGLGDALGRRYATPAMLAGSARLRVTVVGVRSAEDYARVANYLGSLDSLRDTFVVSVSGAQVVFDVTARGGRAALAQAIGFGNLLAPVPAQTDVYELRP